jgi:hypothetical protein
MSSEFGRQEKKFGVSYSGNEEHSEVSIQLCGGWNLIITSDKWIYQQLFVRRLTEPIQEVDS